MSRTYSSSRTLHLPIAESVIRARLFRGLCAALFCALASLLLHGHLGLVLLLAPAVAGGLWQLSKDPLAGASLRLRGDDCRLHDGAVERPLRPRRVALALPWVTQLQVQLGCIADPVSIWLFQDQVSSAQWRRLRAWLRVSSKG